LRARFALDPFEGEGSGRTNIFVGIFEGGGEGWHGLDGIWPDLAQCAGDEKPDIFVGVFESGRESCLQIVTILYVPFCSSNQSSVSFAYLVLSTFGGKHERSLFVAAVYHRQPGLGSVMTRMR
jgi:hypothetical protein